MNFLTRLRRVTTVLFRRQFDAAGPSRRWPATATMASQPADALAARAVLGPKAACAGPPRRCLDHKSDRRWTERRF